MKTLKKVVRVLALTIMIILAASGVGILEAFVSGNSKQYMDKEIRIERLDKNRDEDDQCQEDKS